MLNTIQITGQMQPDAAMVQDELYEEGEILLPREEGRWTLFAVNRIYTKDDARKPREVIEAGYPTPYPVQATWLAADDTAFRITLTRLQKEREEAERRRQNQLIKPTTPPLVI